MRDFFSMGARRAAADKSLILVQVREGLAFCSHASFSRRWEEAQATRGTNDERRKRFRDQ
jgi:hypothetical protein